MLDRALVIRELVSGMLRVFGKLERGVLGDGASAWLEIRWRRVDFPVPLAPRMATRESILYDRRMSMMRDRERGRENGKGERCT